MRIYLIRHGQSEANLDDSLHKTVKDEDIKLSPKGQVQAMKTGDWLGQHLAGMRQQESEREQDGAPPAEQKQKIRIMHSPYERARHTKDLIVGKLSAHGNDEHIDSITPDINLREISHGIYAGYTDEECRAKYGAEYQAYAQEVNAGSERFYNVRPRDGDSYADIAANADNFAPNLQKAKEDGVTDMVIVAHSKTNRIIVKQLTGKSVDEFFQDPSQPNASVRMLEVDDAGKVTDKGYIFNPEIKSYAALEKNTQANAR